MRLDAEEGAIRGLAALPNLDDLLLPGGTEQVRHLIVTREFRDGSSPRIPPKGALT